ncbi:hypothetical protein RclHR1_06380006 [Rhizophagus clarus]|uniref:Ubiquitin-like domain-containing protein n=1 Tax=Rhizophagus clarus TaxID=94130 RepID=A0A2Z6S480_9GLOM|nr:hypothetical protein RclHR1_06380006 [Rhizophagus clarus]
MSEDSNKSLQCNVCKELKNNPRETKCCHKLYCQDCIQKMRDICPTCQKKTNFEENHIASQLIRNKLGDDSVTGNYRIIHIYIFKALQWIGFDLSRNDPDTNPDRNDPDTSDKVFRITILNLLDKKIDVYVEPSDTVEILKLKVYEKDGTAPEYQRLIFLGKQLEDRKAISDYKIRKDDTIHLVNRFNSG